MSFVNVLVEPDGGEPYVVPVVARDVLKWERTTHGASAANLERNPRMADIFALGYVAATRLGKFAGTLAEFEATCDVELASKQVEPDPTNPAP